MHGIGLHVARFEIRDIVEALPVRLNDFHVLANNDVGVQMNEWTQQAQHPAG